MEQVINRLELETRQKKLHKRLAEIKADLGRGLNRNSSEQALELENFEVLEEIARVTQTELDHIERQLAISKDVNVS